MTVRFGTDSLPPFLRIGPGDSAFVRFETDAPRSVYYARFGRPERYANRETAPPDAKPHSIYDVAVYDRTSHSWVPHTLDVCGGLYFALRSAEDFTTRDTVEIRRDENKRWTAVVHHRRTDNE